MVAMIASVFIPVFASSLNMLLAGMVICGVPWGGEAFTLDRCWVRPRC
jgi:hypothetical protein